MSQAALVTTAVPAGPARRPPRPPAPRPRGPRRARTAGVAAGARSGAARSVGRVTARAARPRASRVDARSSSTPAGLQCGAGTTAPPDPASLTACATTSPKPEATPTASEPASSTAGTTVMVSGTRLSRCRSRGAPRSRSSRSRRRPRRAEPEEHPRRDPQYGPGGDRAHGDVQRDERAAHGLLGDGLAERRAEGRESGQGQSGHREQDGDAPQFPGPAVQRVFVDGAALVEEDARAGEQGGLHTGVSEDVQRDPVVGLGRECADADEEQPGVGDRRVRQQSFEVPLVPAHERAERRRHRAQHEEHPFQVGGRDAAGSGGDGAVHPPDAVHAEFDHARADGELQGVDSADEDQPQHGERGPPGQELGGGDERRKPVHAASPPRVRCPLLPFRAIQTPPRVTEAAARAGLRAECPDSVRGNRGRARPEPRRGHRDAGPG